MRLDRILLLPLVVAGAGISGTTWGANGDLTELADHCATSPAAVDLCVDTSDGTYFSLDALSGEFCHIDTDGSLLDTVTHPFGAASFPFFTPVMAGIAYLPDPDDSVVILNRTTQELRQVNKTTGLPIGGANALFPPDPDRNPMGLAYDTIAGTLWYRNVTDNTLVECDLDGDTITTISLPQSDELIYGEGLEFVDVGGTGYLEVTYGTVLECRPARIVRIDLAGDPTGEEVRLDDSSDPVLGIARESSASDPVFCTATTLYSVDDAQPSTLPPTFLTCYSEGDAAITLSWINHGTGVNDGYGAIAILRSVDQGSTFTLLGTLAGDVTSYTDVGPSNLTDLQDQTLVYRVRAGSSVSDPFATCTTRSGSGGLLGYTQFDGSRIYDLAYNQSTGEIYATDTSGGRIYKYDADLNLTDTLTPGLSLMRGVAYDSVLDQLVVSRQGSTLLSLVDPITGSVEVAITTPVSDIEIGSVTYDSDAEDYLYVNLTDGELVRVEAEDAGGPGTLIDECVPPATSGFGFANGVTYLEGGTYLASVDPAAVVQFDAETCFPISGESIPLEVLGQCADPASVTGMVDVTNVLLVASSDTNTIFRLLLIPVSTDFARGDANADSSIDLADALFIADYLFADGTAPACADSADCNDDGVLSISDPVYLILYLFLSGTVPPSPFPDAGLDPTFLDGLGC